MEMNQGGGNNLSEEERLTKVIELQNEAAQQADMVEYRGSKIKQETAQIFAGINQDSFEDHAFGCMIGAFVGDSMGSLVEFIACEVPDDRLDEVFQMPGGGPHKVGPGQITDDSELAMCMLWGFSREEKKPEEKLAKLDVNLLASFYKHWVVSEPFDIGGTTAGALEPLKEEGVTDDELAKVAKFRAFMENRDSASNGCMMRATPLAVWGCNLTKEELRDLSNADVTMTHPHQCPKDACYLYNLGIQFLLQNIEDPDRAEKCFEYCLKETESFKKSRTYGAGGV